MQAKRSSLPPIPATADLVPIAELDLPPAKVVDVLVGPRREVECDVGQVPELMRRDPELQWRGVKYAVDLSKAEAWSGYQWSRGEIHFEQNPDLHPVYARGYGLDPGRFMALRNIAIIEAALEDMAAAVTAATYRLEHGGVRPWHAGDSGAELAAIRHREACERLWWDWQRPDCETGFLTWAADMIRTAPVAGFCLHEIVYEPVWWKLTGDAAKRCYWVPRLEWRAPWSVYKWLTQGGAELPVGVVLQNGYATDTEGNRGRLYVPLGREKFLHVVARDLGRNPEGRSHLRSAWTPANKLSINNQIEGLANEVNGLGTIVAKPGPGGWTPEQAAALDKHVLSYKAGHVPYIRMIDPEASIEIISPNSQVKDFTSVINRDTQAVLMALNSEDKLIGTTKQGSHAARETAANDSWKPYGVAARDYVARPFQRLLGAFLRVNFPLDAALDRICAPRVKIGAIERADTPTRVDTLAKVAAGGLLDDERIAPAVRAAIPELR